MLFPFGVLGQKLSQAIIKGDEAFELYRYYEAVEFYKSALVKNQDDHEAKLKIAESYRKMNDHNTAIEWYSQVLDSTNLDYEDVYKLHYAQALLYNDDKENAKKWFLEYRKQNDGDEVAKKRVEGIEDFESFLLNSERYTINELDINSPSRDFSPAYYDDGIIFISDRKKSHGKNDWDDRVFLNLFHTRLSENGSFFPPKELSNKLNTLYHEGPVSVYNEEKGIVFTRNNYHKKKVKRSEKGVNHLQLFFADISENGQWKNVKPFEHNSAEFSTGHPSMNSKGDLLVFSSDRPDGLGGSDLYYSQLVGDQWSKPINLGKEVNTQGDDLFPFLYLDSILYFSSNGHHGLGGLDVYQAAFRKEETSNIENMGVPINSNVDDFGLIMNEFGTKGFFSSNRESYENDDLYQFMIVSKLVQITVLDEQTRKHIDRADLKITGSKESRSYEYRGKVFEFLDWFDRDFELIINAEGYQSKNYNFSVADVKPGQLSSIEVHLNKATKKEYNGEVELIQAGNRVFLGVDGKLVTPNSFGAPINANEDAHTQLVDMGYDVAKPLEIKSIYYDHDGNNLSDESIKTLNNIVIFMKKYKQTKLNVNSHTDSNGSLVYNNRLSKKRSKTVFEYMSSLDLDIDRIIFNSYGELFPVNNCRDGRACSEEQYQQNRRTEFVINF